MVITRRQVKAALTIGLLFAIMLILPRESSLVPAAALMPSHTAVLLDPGHGAPDGGAAAPDGTMESGINLQIAQRTQALMAFCGVSAALTRTGEQCVLYDPADTIRENKVRDIRERLRLARLHPDSVFISIHLNNFTDPRYSGAQMFYSPNAEGSVLLAEALQARLIGLADPTNDRTVKRAPDTVYLMNNIRTTAVIAECGFLSNPAELSRLKAAEYQRLLALALTVGYLDYQTA